MRASSTRTSLKKQAAAILTVVLVMAFCTGLAIGSEHGPAKTKGWVATDTYRVLNFAALALGLFFLLRKPVSGALNNRIAHIKDELQRLEAQREEAKKALESYNERLVMLDKEAEKIIANYKKQGEAAKARILESAKTAAAKLEEQAKRNIENEFESAKQKLRLDIFEKAMTRAEVLVKGKITSDDQNRLVDEYLDKAVLQ